MNKYSRGLKKKSCFGSICGIDLKGLRLGPQSPFRLRHVPCAVLGQGKGAKTTSETLRLTNLDSPWE